MWKTVCYGALEKESIVNVYEFLELGEKSHNPDFNPLEFEEFRKQFLMMNETPIQVLKRKRV